MRQARNLPRREARQACRGRRLLLSDFWIDFGRRVAQDIWNRGDPRGSWPWGTSDRRARLPNYFAVTMPPWSTPSVTSLPSCMALPIQLPSFSSLRPVTLV
jgi:hypothetical protein